MLTDSEFESIKISRLQRGDMLVLKCQQVISVVTRAALMRQLEGLLPEGVKAVVLDGGLDVEVLRPERNQDQDAAEVALLIENSIRDGGTAAEALKRTYGLQRQGR